MPSKIYEFTLLDKYNTAEGDILRTVEQTLASEAELQGWQPGYSFRQDVSAVRKASGEVEYRFSVYGEFASSTSDSDAAKNTGAQEKASSSAAKPAEL